MSETANDKLKQAVDNAAGAGTADKIEGKATEVIGQGQKAVGDAFDNEKLESEGANNELKGKAQQVGGEIKEEAHTFGEKASDTFHNISTKVKEGASNALDHVKDLLDGDKDGDGSVIDKKPAKTAE